MMSFTYGLSVYDTMRVLWPGGVAMALFYLHCSRCFRALFLGEHWPAGILALAILSYAAGRVIYDLHRNIIYPALLNRLQPSPQIELADRIIQKRITNWSCPQPTLHAEDTFVLFCRTRYAEEYGRAFAEWGGSVIHLYYMTGTLLLFSFLLAISFGVKGIPVVSDGRLSDIRWYWIAALAGLVGIASLCFARRLDMHYDRLERVWLAGRAVEFISFVDEILQGLGPGVTMPAQDDPV